MNMNIIFIGLVILCAFGICFGQNAKPESKPCSFKVKCSTPGVYIKYDHTGQNYIETDSNNATSSFVWLRLHNNTRSRILFNAESGANRSETRLSYEFLDDEDELIESALCRVCSPAELASGKSLLFKVRSEYLKKFSRLRIRFNYGWEGSQFPAREKEPVHFVYFNASPELQKQLITTSAGL